MNAAGDIMDEPIDDSEVVTTCDFCGKPLERHEVKYVQAGVDNNKAPVCQDCKDYLNQPYDDLTL